MPAQVLVGDDHAPSSELISEILRSSGFEAISRTSRVEAAELLTKEKFHAVFLEMRMPPPDGLELARQVRASRVNASAVIIMITAKNRFSERFGRNKRTSICFISFSSTTSRGRDPGAPNDFCF